MTLVAVVPLRDLDTGKSRLRGAVPDGWRQALILALAEGVITAVQQASVADLTVVISPDPQLVAFGERCGAFGLRQSSSGLIRGLWEATNWARARGATSLLAMHGDLPCLDGGSVRALVSALPTTTPAVVIAGDRHQHGTNALLTNPPGAIPYGFGVASFARHQQSAQERGVAAVAWHQPALAFDLDTPADLWELCLGWPAVAERLARAAQRVDPTFPGDLAAILSGERTAS